VRNYKALANVERAFRTMKTNDLKIRPIHHRLADRVRAHICLCMLAYYVEWHLRQAWRELMFADEDQAAKATRPPAAPTQRSKRALRKVATHALDDGSLAPAPSSSAPWI
jgi:transposase